MALISYEPLQLVAPPTLAGKLGQLAIVTSGGQRSTYICVSVVPPVWLSMLGGAGNGTVLPSALASTAPPVDEFLSLTTALTGNRDVRFTCLPADAPLSVRYVVPASTNASLLGVDFNAGLLTFTLAKTGATGAAVLSTTANDIIAANLSVAFPTGNEPTRSLPIGSAGTGVINAALTAPLLLSPFTAAGLGQSLIVTSTNPSGVFKDVWTCSGVTPVRWEPPTGITRSPNGTYYRAIVSNTGVPSTELAYPTL